jgi:protein translocase SecG subunit
MTVIVAIMPYIQITFAALLIIAVLMQRTGAGLGGAFGADNFSSGFHTRRGFEKTLFRATVLFGIIFALSAVINLLVS